MGQLKQRSVSAAEARLRSLVRKVASEDARLVAAARRTVRERLPTACEIVYEYRNWVVISFSPSEQGYEGIFAIRADARGVKLYFNQGKNLADPERVLEGSGRQARFIVLESVATLARPAIVRLLDQAAASSAASFRQREKGRIVLRASGAKRKARRPSAPRGQARQSG